MRGCDENRDGANFKASSISRCGRFKAVGSAAVKRLAFRPIELQNNAENLYNYSRGAEEGASKIWRSFGNQSTLMARLALALLYSFQSTLQAGTNAILIAIAKPNFDL